jgi:Family of unknown function (DUF6498)
MSVDTLGRGMRLYQRTAASRSALALLVANAVPLVGVLFLGWSLWTILVLYWLENGIVGFWNVPRILLARGSPAFAHSEPEAVGPPLRNVVPPIMPTAGRLSVAAIFCFHYGMVWLVHGVFVFVLPLFAGSFGAGATAPAPFGGGLGTDPFGSGPGAPFGDVAAGSSFGMIDWSGVALGGLALFLSHGASFFQNYLRGGEYLRTSPLARMAAPYGRVVVLHLTLILGAIGIAFIGAPIAALVVFVVVKTALDLALHLREHRQLDPV